MVEAHIAPLAPTAAPVVALSKMKPPELAKAINEKVAQMTASARTTVQRAMEIGDLLIEAKKRVGHGKFEKWQRPLPTLPCNCSSLHGACRATT